jgi:hypothetical protein
MVPVQHVELEAFPLTPNGKINRRALLAHDLEASGEQVGYVAPRTDVEQRLVQIWQQVLKVEQVGIHDNFFALGGHSLLATQVGSHILSAFALSVPLAQIFERPTILALASYIEEAHKSQQTTSVPKLAATSRERYRKRVARVSTEA